MEIIKYHKLRCFPPKAYQNHAGIPPGKGKCVSKGRLRYSWSIFAIFRTHNRKLELRGRFSQKFSRKPSRERGKKKSWPLTYKRPDEKRNPATSCGIHTLLSNSKINLFPWVMMPEDFAIAWWRSAFSNAETWSYRTDNPWSKIFSVCIFKCNL